MNKKYNVYYNRQRQTWFIPNNSVAPLLVSINLFNLILIFVGILYSFVSKPLFFFFYISIINLILSTILWFYDLTVEMVHLGNLTYKVQLNVKYGFWLFLASEGMFFVSFFWAFFHFSLSPSIWCGAVWPSEGMVHYISRELRHHSAFDSYKLKSSVQIPVYDPHMNKNRTDLISVTTNFRPMPLFMQYENIDLIQIIKEFHELKIKKNFNFNDYLNYKYSLNNNLFFFNENLILNNNVESLVEEILDNNYLYSKYNYKIINRRIKQVIMYYKYIDNIEGVKRTSKLEEKLHSYSNDPILSYYLTVKTFCKFYSNGGLNHPFGVPALNTLLLITSGLTVSTSHHYFKIKEYVKAYVYLIVTIIISFVFLFLQFNEYKYSNISLNDGAYGSVFFMTTGFHGLHVIIGTIMLIVCLFKMYFNHFSVRSHIFFKCSIWYWHFVDIVWVALFIVYYWWGTSYCFRFHDYEDSYDGGKVFMNLECLTWLLHIFYNSVKFKDEDINFFDYNKNYLTRDIYHRNFMWHVLDVTFLKFYYDLEAFKTARGYIDVYSEIFFLLLFYTIFNHFLFIILSGISFIFIFIFLLNYYYTRSLDKSYEISIIKFENFYNKCILFFSIVYEQIVIWIKFPNIFKSDFLIFFDYIKFNIDLAFSIYMDYVYYYLKKFFNYSRY